MRTIRTREHAPLAAILGAMTFVLAATCAEGRSYDAAQPWFVEGSVGAVLPGPDGTDFGNGQNYGIHLGYQRSAWMDFALSLAWADARDSDRALDSDVTSGGLRARGWIGAGRWSPYAEVGARLYRFSIQQNDVSAFSSAATFALGGLGGAGVLYTRSTWWAGAGAELHAAVGELDLESGNIATFFTLNVFVGAPLPR